MSSQILEAIFDFIEALDDPSRRRRRPRQPFSRPVKLTNSEGTVVWGVTRNICRDGVGLLHNMPLEPGVYQLEIVLHNGTTIDVAAELRWCRKRDNDYISGAQFLSEMLR